ncbi:MAG: DnaD domain protein [Clostridia bacterium]|nr:DnaD domain protein [Clostridia bacterium]
MRKFTAGGEAVTPVPTAFLAKDMLDAPSDYVKVYLYGLYLSEAETPESDMVMENKLHMKGSEIDQALRYWADRGRIKTEETPEGPVYSFKTPGGAAAAKAAPKEPARREMYPYAAFNLRAADIMQRELKPAELKRLYSYMEEDKLPQDLVLRLLEYCVGLKGKNINIAYVDRVEEAWIKRGIRTLEGAEEAIAEFQARSSGARQIMRLMGILDKAPGQTELEYYRKWTKDWGFAHEGIVAAMQGKEFSKSNPFKYLDAILSGYHERGAHRAQEIAELSNRTDERDARIKEILKALNYRSLAVTQSHVDYLNNWQRAGFSQKIILLACSEATRSGRRSLDRVDQYLQSWKKHGLLTETQIRSHIAQQNELVELIRQVYEMAGITAPIEEKDKNFYLTYTKQCGMEHDVLLLAAELSSITEHPGRYMRSILKQWAKADVHRVDEAMAMEQRRAESRINVQPPNYPQRPAPPASYADERGRQSVEELRQRFGTQ